MRLIPSDPDVETIISRIEARDLNLQPDFQRGEVWSKAKKQRLVDSVLRDWHVPPIHVIELTESRRQEVLDGQQRLVAIRDFYRNDFPVDGAIEPADPKIAALDGKLFRDLPDDARRRFQQFTIRFFRIVDYESSEPAELFFRLNQPTNLTAAEQRNAFFGVVRQQIKDLVESLGSYGLERTFLGFSNSRMAYDDVLCRVALTVERGTIADKISSSDLVELYRADVEISHRNLERIRSALQLMGYAAGEGLTHPRFNKATLYSWLVFLIRAKTVNSASEALDANAFGPFMEFFETRRLLSELELNDLEHLPTRAVDWLFQTYDDRSTSRVADVSSVVLRDMVIWFAFALYRASTTKAADIQVALPSGLTGITQSLGVLEADAVAKALIDSGWGALK